ncbi:MAG: hypothetical protein A3F67_10950 [Verrucomicrobia bacterium RIFCSPHIGHO2_12_FULL_41_10]|nr:MAG: hypothetical protein A3F67_10950 [Verrucomicrobia bacterium RIFCSPHIGHO2_12_FULL_41_10]
MSNIHIGGWSPKPHKVKYPAKPKEVPEWLYNEAKAAKRQYNENWEFWVYETAKQHDVSIEEAERACIRGISRELFKIKLIYGSMLAGWFENYLEMSSIFEKVNKLTGDVKNG